MRYGERVERIVTEKSRVRGVALEDGEIVAARSVVAAADIRQTFHRLLDPGLVPADFRQLLAETPVSDTFVILSLVLDRDPAAWGFDRIDAYYTETPDIDRALTPNDPEHSMISLQFPEFHATRGDTRLFGLQIVAPATFEYRDHWETGPGYARTEAYHRLKEEFAGRLIARAESYMPGLREHIVSLDIATPLTMYRYTLNDWGRRPGGATPARSGGNSGSRSPGASTWRGIGSARPASTMWRSPARTRAN